MALAACASSWHGFATAHRSTQSACKRSRQSACKRLRLQVPAPILPTTLQQQHLHVCSFSKFPLPMLPFGNVQIASHEADDEACAAQRRNYDSMLQQAEHITFSYAPGQFQLAGHAMLEDGEHLLELCIQERPRHLQPRVVLLRNLMRQSQGREREVPLLAIKALQEGGVSGGADVTLMRQLQVLQIALLGLKALYKLQEDGHTSPLAADLPTCSVPSFLAAAQAAAPAFATDFNKLALRVQRQVMCCSNKERRRLLSDRDGYMSSVDLSAVLGTHHASATAATTTAGAGAGAHAGNATALAGR